jgi:hypothetical protein
MTLLHYVLILLTPVFSYFIIKSGLTIRADRLKVILIPLTILSLTIFFSPISFIGEWIDFIVFLLCISTFHIYTFLKKDAVEKGLFKRIGLIFFIFVLLLLEAFYAQFTGAKDWSSYLTITKITTDKDYRLIHRKVNTNFMYSGTHLITIKQTIKLMPILEYRVGIVNAGQYFDNAIPSQFEYLIDSNKHRLIIKSGSDTSISF